MNGMEILMKSMGVDPKQIIELINSVGGTAQNLDKKMDTVLTQQTALDEKLNRILAILEKDETK